MRKIGLMTLAAGLAIASVPTAGAAQVSAGVVLDHDGLRSFHLAIGQHYGIPVRTVRRHAALRIHRDELPVVYLLAREARVAPETVIALRGRGWTWMDVAHHLRVRPQVFVAHLPRGGPPSYWRQPRGKALRNLSDRQIVDYVNLAFRADHYREPVDRVIVLRESQRSWSGVQMKEHPGRGNPGRAPAPPPRRN